MSYLPSRRLVLLLATAAPLFLVSGTLGLVGDILLILAAAADSLRVRRVPLEVTRSNPARLSHGTDGIATLLVENRSGRAVRIRVTDYLSPRLQRLGKLEDGVTGPARPEPVQDPEGPRADRMASANTAAEGPSGVIMPLGELRFRYIFRGVERGTAVLGDIHLRVLGPLGLVWHRRRIRREDIVRVQPGLQHLRRYRLLAHRHRLKEMGLRTMRSPGESGAFESLREYVRGDDPRRLDWKASGKRGALIVRQMAAERSQNVVLAIDAGRLMTEELPSVAGDSGEGGLRRERMDSALAAALLLAQVAGQHGDRVGLFVFSDRVHRFLPPARAPLSRIAEALTDVEARLIEPDYPAAFAFLGRQLRRRSLLVLLTDVIDARSSAALLAHAAAATRRHLPLAVVIRNPALELVAAAPVNDDAGVYRRAAAEELLQLRSLALSTMRRAGVLVADTTPDEAVPAVVNRYLEVKRRGRL